MLKWFKKRKKEQKPAENVKALYVNAKMVRDAGGGRGYVEFPDGLRLIFEGDKYVGFYTQEPNKEG